MVEYSLKKECFTVPITKDELARILNVSFVTVDRLVREKAIGYIKVRSAVRFTKENIDDYLESITSRPVSKKNTNGGEK
jgi:excisionase family DNA binding protein